MVTCLEVVPLFHVRAADFEDMVNIVDMKDNNVNSMCNRLMHRRISAYQMLIFTLELGLQIRVIRCHHNVPDVEDNSMLLSILVQQ